MAKRKINLQNIGESSPSEKIDDMVRGFGTMDLGFSPTGQSIYEVDIDKIFPDPKQPRYFLPHDLRASVNERAISARDALKELLTRANSGDILAQVILGQTDSAPDDGDERDDEKGLRALAESIREVGLRQPVNVYSVANADVPGATEYQIAEGERRYWAHQLLVINGHDEFRKVRCVIEPLPVDKELIRRRQQAENAARQDLSAIARARAIQQIRDRLRIEMGTRVPGESSIKLPSQREVDEAVGREVKAFSGRAIGGRMVRNYVRLLQLPPDLQDVAEAAGLTEKQLRPVMKAATVDKQRQLVMSIVERGMSGRAVADLVDGVQRRVSTRQVSVTSLEGRLEKQLLRLSRLVVGLGEGDEYSRFVMDVSRSIEQDQGLRDSLSVLYAMLRDILAADVDA